MRLSTRGAIAMLLLAFVCHHARAQSGYVIQTVGNPDAANVELGTTIAVVGDVDGDARDDYLVGDPYATTLWGGGGDVRLVSGATGATIRAHQGDQSLGAFGAVLAGVGDLNSDGVPDYAIGSPWFGAVQSWGSPPAYLSAPGKVSVWSGATGAPLFTVTGGTTQVPGGGYGGGPSTYGDNLGTSICGPGDVTGDGVPDLVIGAPGASPASQIQRGKFVIRSGATGTIITVDGISAGEQLGWGVCAPGGLDGDGVGDIVASAPGGYFAAVRAYTIVSGTVLWSAPGPPVSTFGFSAFGYCISSAGDVDADGVNDVIVGASSGVPMGQSFPSPPGQAFVLSGTTGLQICSMSGTSSGEGFGLLVAKAGDVNGDGFGDVLVSSPNFGYPNTGRVQLFMGPSCATSQLVALGAFPNDKLGRGLAGGAFLDGDAVPDILIGAPESPGLGRVHARSGATFVDLYQLHGTPAPFLPGRFTAAVDAGDQDGDGRPDLALGRVLVGSNSSIALVSGATSQIIRLLPGPVPYGYTYVTAPVVCPGDIDGDGYKDLALATATGYASVQLDVVSGFSAGLLYTMTWSSCGLPGVRMIAPSDVDGDGIRDLVIGLPVASTCSSPAIGMVELRSGATGTLIAQASGAAVSDDFASSIASIGDLDGDGTADLVVGAPAFQTGLPGSVLVLSGTTLAPLVSVTGTGPGQRLGAAVAGIGDVTGDGIPDFAATEGVSTALAVVRLFSGAGGVAIGSIPSPPLPVNGFGIELAGVGDVNGDGVPDIAVSAPYTTASATGPSTYVGEVFVFSGTGGPPLFTVRGRYANESLGWTLTDIGDRNEDGLADIFAGAGTSSGPHAEILSFAGVPSGSHVIGTSCVLASGRRPSLSAFGGDPTSSVGNAAFGLIVSNGTAGCAGALVAGLSASSWNGVSLPIGLGPVLSGCSQYVSIDALITFALAGPAGGLGAVQFPIPVPMAPNLAGASVHFQAYVADQPLATLPGAVTRGLTIVVQ